jgi:hypothetical protein
VAEDIYRSQGDERKKSPQEVNQQEIKEKGKKEKQGGKKETGYEGKQ